MPRVPDYVSQTQTTRMPQPRAAPAANADVYGAPVIEGVSKLAQAATGAAYRIVQQEIEKVDTAQLQGAYAKLGAWRQANIDHPDTGLAKRRGKDALGLSDVKLKEFDEYSTKVAAELANDRQRQGFEQMRMRERETLAHVLNRHEAAESDAYVEANEKGAVETSIGNAANSYDDPKAMAEAREVGEATILSGAKRRGFAPDSPQVQAARSVYRTQFHLSVLNRMTDAAETNPAMMAAAKSYLERHGGDIDGKARAQSNIDKIVAAAGIKHQAASLATGIQGQAPDDLEAQMRLAQAIPEVEVQDEVVQRLTRTNELIKSARKAKDTEHLGRVRQGLETNGGYLDRHSKDFVSLSDDGKADAMAIARQIRLGNRQAVADERRAQDATNAEALNDFLRISKEDPGASLNVNVEEAYRLADKVTRLRIQTAQAGVKNQITKGQQAQRQQVLDFVKAKSQQFKGKGVGEKLQTEVLEWYHTQETPPTIEEVRRHIAERTEIRVIERPWLPDPEKPAFQMTPEEYAKSKAKAAPAEQPQNAPANPRPSKGQRTIQLIREGKSNDDIKRTLAGEGY